MPFRLRHGQHNFELVVGDFLIGRDPQCQLVLDDPLVSRKHAKLLVGQDTVKITDLGSRNGVSVNGAKLGEPRELTHADRILIGSQEMMIVAYLPSAATGSGGPPTRVGSATLTAMAAVTPSAEIIAVTPVPPSADPAAPTPSLPVVGDTTKVKVPAAWKKTAANEAPPASFGKDSGPRAGVPALLWGLADKALGLGRTDEAERIISGLANEVLKNLEQGQDVPAETVDLAGQYSVRLAVATGKGKWVDYVVNVYTRTARPFPAAIIDELHNAIRKIDAVDLKALRAYVALLREKAATHGPAERFLVQRIEGLERLAALR